MPAEAQVLTDTWRWLERAVVGLNLCPFAKGVLAKGQVHFAVLGCASTKDVLAALEDEVQALLACDPSERDTTLLVLQNGFEDFLGFHALTQQAERLLRKRGWAGTVQVASFHPAFEFAGAAPDDPGNYSNRAPYPTLHLLREASIARAVEAFPDAAAIYDANIETLRRLGPDGWRALDVGPHP